LSGIGFAEHLRERQIEVLVDLPVGRHTQDHQEFFLGWKFPNTYNPGFSFLTEILSGFPELSKYNAGQRGFFSSNGISSGLDGSSKGPNGTVPTWHMHHVTLGTFENFDANLAEYLETVSPPYRIPRNLVELLLYRGTYIHMHDCELSGNHAYGKIELKNRDPFSPPFVDPRYGSSDEDNYELVNCIKTMRAIMNKTDPNFSGVELEPSASAKTDEQLLQVVRNNVWGHHMSGSAPMGNCSNPYAVTDYKGRVFGVSGLRVADISLFPTIPHGNPAGVVMMIGEKIADQILSDYGAPNTGTL